MNRNIQRFAGAFLVMVGSSVCFGDLILEDFTIPVFLEGSAPVTRWSSEGLEYANGRRTMAANRTGIPPTVQIDSSITSPSILRITASDIPPLDYNSFGQLSFAHVYYELFDLTQGGMYNAFQFDFTFSRGPTAVRNMQIITGEFLFSMLDPLPITEERFRVTVPFDTFIDRGGSPPSPGELESVPFFEVQFQTTGNPWYGFPQPQDLGWEVGLDRFSLVSIPEPSAWILLVIGSLVLLRRSTIDEDRQASPRRMRRSSIR